VSVEIPWTRVAKASIPRPVLSSGNQEGPFGGISLPIHRLGDRFAYDVTTAQFRQDAESRLFIAALIEATTADARMAIRQFNLQHTPGLAAAAVDGAGQAGSALKLRGLLPAATTRRGQFFSVVHDGRHYLHMATAEVSADPAGKASIPIWPMLRFLTLDGEPCLFDRPVIEGQLVGFDPSSVNFERNRITPIRFSIAERA
jgi:hypothetical protein